MYEKYKNLFIIISILFVFILVICFILLKSQKEYLDTLSTVINTKLSEIEALSAVATYPQQIANSTTACTVAKKTEYNQYLNDIETLDVASLQKLEGLFQTCAYVDVNGQELLQVMLEAEVNNLEDLVNIYNVKNIATARWQTDLYYWQEFTTLKRKLLVDQAELIAVQNSIISLLAEGDDAMQFKLLDKRKQALQIKTDIIEIKATISSLGKET